MRLLRSFLGDERGATVVEYGLIISIISMAMLVGFGQASGALNDLFQYLGGTVEKKSP